MDRASFLFFLFDFILLGGTLVCSFVFHIASYHCDFFFILKSDSTNHTVFYIYIWMNCFEIHDAYVIRFIQNFLNCVSCRKLWSLICGVSIALNEWRSWVMMTITRMDLKQQFRKWTWVGEKSQYFHASSYNKCCAYVQTIFDENYIITQQT